MGDVFNPRLESHWNPICQVSEKCVLLAILNSSCLSKQKGKKGSLQSKTRRVSLRIHPKQIHRTIANSIKAAKQKPSSSWGHSSEKATPNASKSK
ncbi:hypothetical protein CEXT_419951 [Caerostris extrusa]|uniref:Uncharacterized protein n=1 Tax=Caerostris extrusa TaxID=172846 RepID=A0AAV4XGP4_CAEEX|nr:hypothetical protein CEXT_419951 [Caerostris extrusa]